MKRFVEGEARRQIVLLPPCLDDYVTENNPVRVIEAFVDELDLATLGFDGVVPEATGRPAYHPSVLLKLYLYGYPQSGAASSRRLEREAAVQCRGDAADRAVDAGLQESHSRIFARTNGSAIRATHAGSS